MLDLIMILLHFEALILHELVELVALHVGDVELLDHVVGGVQEENLGGFSRNLN